MTCLAQLLSIEAASVGHDALELLEAGLDVVAPSEVGREVVGRSHRSPRRHLQLKGKIVLSNMDNKKSITV